MSDTPKICHMTASDELPPCCDHTCVVAPRFTRHGIMSQSSGTSTTEEALAAIRKSMAVTAIAKYREWQITEELKKQSLELLEATLKELPEWAKPTDVVFSTETLVKFKVGEAPRP